MTSQPQSGAGSPADLPPHADPARWSDLIASLAPDAILVVIASSMSRSLRAHCSPEDIWQETLTLAWRDRERHTWNDERAFRAWIFEIARNRIRDAARSAAAVKRSGDRLVPPPADASSALSALHPADSATPSRNLAREEKRAAVGRVLSELRPDLAQVVRLHLIEELTMEEVAERLGIGLSAAWHRFRKGAEECARLLPGWTPGGSSSTW